MKIIDMREFGEKKKSPTGMGDLFHIRFITEMISGGAVLLVVHVMITFADLHMPFFEFPESLECLFAIDVKQWLHGSAALGTIHNLLFGCNLFSKGGHFSRHKSISFFPIYFYCSILNLKPITCFCPLYINGQSKFNIKT